MVAVPSIGALGTPTGLGSGTALTIPVPSGVLNEHLVLVFLYYESTTVTVTPPSGQGFAPVPDGALVASSGISLRVFWKRSEGSEPSPNYVFTLSGSAFRRGQAVSITDADTSANPWDATDGLASTSNSTSTPAVSIATTGPDRLALWVGGSNNTGAWGTVPSGFTKRTPPSGNLEMATASMDVPSAQSLSSLVGVSGGSSCPTAAWVGALKPVGSVEAGAGPTRFFMTAC